MTLSLFLSIVSAIIAVLGFYAGFLTRKANLITYIENQLIIRAKECNQYIIQGTLQPPVKTEDVSAVLTNIIYSKRIIDLNYKHHKLLLSKYDGDEFILFFYLQVHTSIIELVKCDLPSGIDPFLIADIASQHLACQGFLKKIIDLDPSKP